MTEPNETMMFFTSFDLSNVWSFWNYLIPAPLGPLTNGENNYMRIFIWDVITHPCQQLPAVDVMAWMCKCITLLYVYVITYPCPDPDTGLVILCD